MELKIQFNPCYSVQTIETDNIFFLSEREKVWLNDHLSYTLDTFIDGDRNIDEIIDTIQQSLLQDPKSSQSVTTFF